MSALEWFKQCWCFWNWEVYIALTHLCARLLPRRYQYPPLTLVTYPYCRHSSSMGVNSMFHLSGCLLQFWSSKCPFILTGCSAYARIRIRTAFQEYASLLPASLLPSCLAASTLISCACRTTLQPRQEAESSSFWNKHKYVLRHFYDLLVHNSFFTFGLENQQVRFIPPAPLLCSHSPTLGKCHSAFLKWIPPWNKCFVSHEASSLSRQAQARWPKDSQVTGAGGVSAFALCWRGHLQCCR